MPFYSLHYAIFTAVKSVCCIAGIQLAMVGCGIAIEKSDTGFGSSLENIVVLWGVTCAVVLPITGLILIYQVIKKRKINSY